MELHHFTDSSLVTSEEAELIGYSMSASTDAEVVIRNGTDGSATGVVFILFGSGQSMITEAGVVLDSGIYIDIVSGTVEGTVWIK